jgi:hypothetical protein
MKKERALLIMLVVLNFIVLLGQLWPEGAPAFAGVVNIIFLVFSLLYFIFLLKKK